MGNTHEKKSRIFDQLTQDQMSHILENTGFDREQLLDWHKGFLHECPTGRMNKESFNNFYSKIFPNGKTEKFCKNVFKVFDTDNSGFIDFTELMISISITSLGNVKNKIALAFLVYDIDKNGAIDEKEMTTLIQALFELLNFGADVRSWSSADKAKEIMLKLDTNRDSLLSRSEFLEGCINDQAICNILVPYS